MGCMVLGLPLMISAQRLAVLGHFASEVPACPHPLFPSCTAHWQLWAAEEKHSISMSPAPPSTHPWGALSPARVFLETTEGVDGAYFTAKRKLTGVLSSLHLPSWLFLTSVPCCLKGRNWGQHAHHLSPGTPRCHRKQTKPITNRYDKGGTWLPDESVSPRH